MEAKSWKSKPSSGKKDKGQKKRQKRTGTAIDKKDKKDKKGQAQRLTDMVISVNFVDCSGSLSWGFYCDYLPFSTC